MDNRGRLILLLTSLNAQSATVFHAATTHSEMCVIIERLIYSVLTQNPLVAWHNQWNLAVT